MTQTVLVTGGADFIGSHATVALQQAGYHAINARTLDSIFTQHPPMSSCILLA